MAEVKGKFITLGCSLLQTKPQAKKRALEVVKELTGKEYNELEQEGWYDTKVLDAVFQAIRENSTELLANASIKFIGQQVYPTVEKTVGLPPHLESPLDFIKFEAEHFGDDHRGSDVKPRKILQATEGHVVMEAVSPGYDCMLIEGVYLGILEMCGAENKAVKQTKCVKRGDAVCEYEITWKAG